MKIPKYGSDQLSGHHLFFNDLHKPLKLLTLSSAWTQAVDTSHPQYTFTKREAQKCLPFVSGDHAPNNRDTGVAAHFEGCGGCEGLV